MEQKIIWSARALARMKEINDFIAQDSIAAADRFCEEMVGHVESLAAFPRGGVRLEMPGARSEVRKIFHGPYRIIYALHATGIRILDVAHMSRSL